jgi:hypothetical protein
MEKLATEKIYEVSGAFLLSNTLKLVLPPIENNNTKLPQIILHTCEICLLPLAGLN